MDNIGDINEGMQIIKKAYEIMLNGSEDMETKAYALGGLETTKIMEKVFNKMNEEDED